MFYMTVEARNAKEDEDWREVGNINDPNDVYTSICDFADSSDDEARVLCNLGNAAVKELVRFEKISTKHKSGSKTERWVLVESPVEEVLEEEDDEDDFEEEDD